jgi:phosphatidylinositol-3-phosphatase
VIWVWMENHNYDSVIGSKSAPFANHLGGACGLATNYHNITHPSLPNYVAATSGSTLGITDDCSPSDCSRNAQSLFGQVQGAGLTWRTYSESMPTVCDLQDGTGLHPPGDYVAHHNPAVYYLPLRSQCDQAVVPLGTPTSGSFADALGSDSLPAFSFVSPNLCDSTHDCPVSVGDLWLSHWVRAIVSSRAYRAGTTAIFITWDEGEQGGSDDCAFNVDTAGCHVPMVVVSPSTRPGTRATELFNHYSLLKTTEQLLGISPFLAQANDPRTKSMAEGFNLSSG